MSGEVQKGTIKWFNTTKGFGFITTPDGPDVFVHNEDCKRAGIDPKILLPGVEVSFTSKPGKDGVKVDTLINS